MKVKAGDKVRLTVESKCYTGTYAGTLVEIEKVDTDSYCTVIGYDGHKFMCPISYFEDDDFFNYGLPPKKCECGVLKTYGENAPAWFHSDYCPMYMPRKE